MRLSESLSQTGHRGQSTCRTCHSGCSQRAACRSCRRADPCGSGELGSLDQNLVGRRASRLSRHSSKQLLCNFLEDRGSPESGTPLSCYLASLLMYFIGEQASSISPCASRTIRFPPESDARNSLDQAIQKLVESAQDAQVAERRPEGQA